MTLTVVTRPSARRDIDHCADHLGRTSRTAGRRFYDALQTTVERLAEMPGVGSPFEVENERLQGLRVSRVQGFDSHLLFYLVAEDELILVRILHGARDIEGILERERG